MNRSTEMLTRGFSGRMTLSDPQRQIVEGEVVAKIFFENEIAEGFCVGVVWYRAA